SELSLREREISSREAELSEARTALSDGRREYEDGQRTLARETAEAQEKIDDAREELGKLEKPEIYVLGRDTNVGYASYENDSSIVAGIARVFPFFFFLVAALVCMTTMNRMVEEQRTQIGVLKALGYSEASIMGKYLFYAGSAAVAGAVVGFLTGSVLFPSVIWTAYKIMYRMGDYMVLWSVPLAVQSLAVALLCSMGTTCLTCRYELKSAAAELIRPRAPKSGKRIWLEHLPFLWNRLSFLTKVSIRNVFRYRQRFFMMVMGIGGCTALLLTGFGVKDTIADVGALQFGEIQLYDMSATLKNAYEPGDAREDAELSRTLEQDVQDWLAVSEKSVDITGTEGVRTASLVIPRDVRAAPDYVGLHTEEGEPVAWPGVGEAVLNDNLAKRCGIKTGDTIRLSVGDGEELEVRVTALCRNFISNYVYISPETWEEGIGTAPEYRSLYLHTAKGIRDRALAEKLLACDAVSTVSVNADMLNQVENMMGSLDSVVLLIILCAGALAFIVIYNLTNINITERIREIATIKVLGFYPRETSAYVFRENVLLTAIGAAAGLLGGIWLLHFVMARIDIDMISFQVRILPISYIRSVLLTFAFMLVVDVMMYVKLGKINMAESLKSVE
ncbi:MAG: ABC transporter permease, partial [Eubacteriales bacterium]|nr:ABC transporter permease [Eubacteriales bacterium]